MDSQQVCGIIKQNHDQLTNDILRHPKTVANFGKKEKESYVKRDLLYLAKAVSINSTVVFRGYISWAKIVCNDLNTTTTELVEDINIMQEVLKDFDKQVFAVASPYLEQALEEINKSDLGENKAEMTTVSQQYIQLLLQGQRHLASKYILTLVEKGMTVQNVYMNVFQPAQEEVGRLWQIKKISVAQEHYCTAATQLVMSQLYPYIMEGEKNKGVFVAACVGGDLHEVGLRMVADLFELEGWYTFYLGANVPLESIIDAIKEKNADILALSTTMVFHIDTLQEVISAIRQDVSLKNLKIIVGGYFLNLDENLWKKFNADGYAKNAQDALRIVPHLMEK